MLGDDHPVANVASSAPIWRNGGLGTLEAVLEQFFDRMAFQTEIMHFATLG